MKKAIAIIGTREPSAPERILCGRFGRLAAKKGLVVRTGRAEGVDAAGAEGAASVDPALVHHYVPWDSYNLKTVTPHIPSWCSLDRLADAHLKSLEEITSRLYPNWEWVDSATRKLHMRNVAIILGANGKSPVNAVLALPRQKDDSNELGGTGFGMLLAKHHGIPLFDLREKAQIETARAWLEGSLF